MHANNPETDLFSQPTWGLNAGPAIGRSVIPTRPRTNHTVSHTKGTTAIFIKNLLHIRTDFFAVQRGSK